MRLKGPCRDCGTHSICSLNRPRLRTLRTYSKLTPNRRASSCCEPSLRAYAANIRQRKSSDKGLGIDSSIAEQLPSTPYQTLASPGYSNLGSAPESTGERTEFYCLRQIIELRRKKQSPCREASTRVRGTPGEVNWCSNPQSCCIEGPASPVRSPNIMGRATRLISLERLSLETQVLNCVLLLIFVEKGDYFLAGSNTATIMSPRNVPLRHSSISFQSLANAMTTKIISLPRSSAAADETRGAQARKRD